jgi:hypothetical protein
MAPSGQLKVVREKALGQGEHSATDMMKLANSMLCKRSNRTTVTSEARTLRGAQALCCVGNQQEPRRVKGNMMAPRHMGRSKKDRSASSRRRASVISYECQKPATATVKILVVCLLVADKYFRPLPSPLRGVNQRVMTSCIGFSGPR